MKNYHEDKSQGFFQISTLFFIQPILLKKNISQFHTEEPLFAQKKNLFRNYQKLLKLRFFYNNTFVNQAKYYNSKREIFFPPPPPNKILCSEMGTFWNIWLFWQRFFSGVHHIQDKTTLQQGLRLHHLKPRFTCKLCSLNV